MKIFGVHFMSESSDHYYESFKAESEPSIDEIEKAFEVQFGEEAEYINVESVWEIKPTIEIKSKPKRKKK